MSTQINAFSKLPTKIIGTSEDAVIDNLDSQLHVFSSTDPATPGETITVTLPCNPQIGERHLIVATSAGVVLDGNGTPIVRAGSVDPSAVAVGSAVELVFSQDPSLKGDCGCNGNGAPGTGAWIAIC